MGLGVAVLGLLLAACGGSPGGPRVEDGRSSASPTGAAAATDGRIWFDVLGVSQRAPSSAILELAEDEASFADLWSRYQMDGPAPAQDFDEQVVLFVGREDDACPDDLVWVKAIDGALTLQWLPPAGFCEQPALATGYAVALHRGDLGTSMSVALTQAYADDATATFELPAYAGPAAPAPPDVPMRPTDDDIAAVFAGHPVRPCDDVDDPMLREPEVDGALSSDPAVAAAQRGRASMGFPSDEDTTRRLLEDPTTDDSFGFPLTQDEIDSVWERQNLLDGEEMLEFGRRHADTFGYAFLDQAAGGVYTFGFTDDLEARAADLRQAFPDVPTAVQQAPFTKQELEAAHEPIMAALQAGEFGSGSLSVGLVRVELGIVDPTRETLDRIAELTDPSKVCVRADFSGVPSAG